MTIFSISCLMNGVLSLLLGLFVILKNRKSGRNKLWFLTSLSVSIWSFGLLGVVMAETDRTAYIANRILYIGAILIPIFYFHFVIKLLKITRKIIMYLGYSIALIYFSINIFLPHIFVKSVPPFPPFKHWLEPGYLYYPFFIFFIFFAIYSIYLLGKYYKKSRGIKREQIKFLLIASIIGFSGGFTDFFPQIINIYPFGNYFVAIYVIIITYAIIKYRFFEIKFIIKKGLLYSILLIIVFVIFAFFIFLAGYLFQSVSRLSYIITASICAFVIALIFQPLRKILYQWLNNIYYQRKTEQELKLVVDQAIKKNANLSKVLEKISVIIMEDISVAGACFVVYNARDKKYELGYSSQKQKIEILATEYFISVLKRENKIFIKEELPFIKEGLENEEEIDHLDKIKDKLEKLDMELVMPFVAMEELVAILFLGKKNNNKSFSVQDVKYLNELADQTGFYIANALLYKQAIERLLR